MPQFHPSDNKVWKIQLPSV